MLLDKAKEGSGSIKPEMDGKKLNAIVRQVDGLWKRSLAEVAGCKGQHTMLQARGHPNVQCDFVNDNSIKIKSHLLACIISS